MRFTIVGAVAALVALAQAQSVVDLPKCAQECVGSSLESTGCKIINVKCFCEQADWIAGLSCCVEKACNADDQAKTISFAGTICKSVGITVPSNAHDACAARSSNATSSAAVSGSSSTTSVVSSTSSVASLAATSRAGAAGAAASALANIGNGIGLAAAGLLAIAF